MDAGVAAVVGAAIGGGLAGLTAIGTGWFALRVARLQVASQETQAERQLRFESLRERREPRAKAYAEFLDLGHQVAEVLGRVSVSPSASERFGELRTLSAKVSVMGPLSVAEAADEVVASLASWLVANATRAVTEGDTLRVAGSLKEFAEAARAALEDDGNPEPTVSPPGP
ncbi:hypothetical protein ACN6K5_001313 [Streptomyces violaceoruber]|uniref:hypothetical protein n=1 Tax=Streptomyces violaceoruber group TaxID=2867121 RepID=UPI0033FD77B2